MKSIVLFVALLLGSYSCSPNKKALVCNKQINQCHEIEAVNIADCAMKKYKYKVETLHRTVSVSDTIFLVQYTPKDTTMRGGGGEVRILKENCEVLNVKFYQ